MGDKNAAADIKNDIPVLIANAIGNQLATNFQLTLTKVDAAALLWSISVLESKRQEIIDNGGVRCMTNMLATGTMDGKMCAAGVLQQLVTTAESDDVKAEVVAAKGIQSFVWMLQNGTDAAVQVSSDCLRLIATKADLALKMAPVVIPALLPHISDYGHDKRHTAALSCLHQITRHGHKGPFLEIPRTILEVGLMKPVAALVGKSPAAALSSTGILYNLSKVPDPSYVTAILETGALPSILTRLTADHPDTRTAAIGCVRSFLDEHGGRKVPVELKRTIAQGALKDIVDLMAPCDLAGAPRVGGTPEAQTNAAACLWLLAVEPDLAPAVAEAGAVPLLSALLNPAPPPGAKGKKPKKGGPLSLEDRTRRFYAEGCLWCLCDESDRGAERVTGSDPAVPNYLLKVWTPVTKRVFHGQHETQVQDLYKIFGVPNPNKHAGRGPRSQHSAKGPGALGGLDTMAEGAAEGASGGGPSAPGTAVGGARARRPSGSGEVADPGPSGPGATE